MPDLPDADDKRKLLHDERTTPETLNALADEFLEAGRLGEALDMLAVTGDAKRLRALREHAISIGEVFVLTQTERFLEDEASAKDWRATAEKAFADARWRQAETAFRRAGDEERAAEAAARIIPAPTCRPEKMVEPE